jgi:oligosaccharide reducing-end xylanase
MSSIIVGRGIIMSQSKGSFYTKKYRNVFNELGYSKEEINKRVNDAFNEMFYGDEDTRIYHPSGEEYGYMVDTGNNDARTEGMSYGMMMCVQMDKKEEFDRLWKWSKKYMWHESGKYARYFAWSCSLDGTRNAQGPAPDGEEYFAMALFFASHRWGDGPEPLNYSTQAKEILKACVHKGEDGIGDPMWEPSNKLIKFIPESPFSDPSYHLPHFYELFSLWAYEEDRKFWSEAAAASREYLKIACHPVTGLAPEYAHYDGTPETTRGHQNFYSDAYRVAMNIGLDYEWFKADEWEIEEANKIQNFFASIDDINDYKMYKIEGTPLEEKALHPVGLLATNAMASLAARGENAEEVVRKFWNTPLRTGVRRYYDNCLYFFSLMALSGKYRIW